MMIKSDFSRDEIAEKRAALFGLLSRKQKRAVDFRLFFRGTGFYSEMNNLAMLLLYCLHHGIRFRLDSSDLNINIGVKEWTTLFHPFCEEVNKKKASPHLNVRRAGAKALHHAIMSGMYEQMVPLRILTVPLPA